jgi:hypothetical protein
LPAASRIVELSLLSVIFASSTFAQSRLAEFRSRFEQESNPVHRAKMMHDLGAAEFQEIARDVGDGNLKEALALAEEYRDEARVCVKELDAKSIDAEKHPAGFKQLELSLRESLRRLNDVLVGLAVDEQEPFFGVRDDIEQLDQHVIHELFPRRPTEEAQKPKEKQ